MCIELALPLGLPHCMCSVVMRLLYLQCGMGWQAISSVHSKCLKVWQPCARTHILDPNSLNTTCNVLHH